MHQTTFSTASRKGGRFDIKSARGKGQDVKRINRDLARGIRQAIDQRRSLARKLRAKASAYEERQMPGFAQEKRERARSLEQAAKRLEEKLNGATT